MRCTSCRRSLRDTIFDIDRGVIGSAWPGGDDCAACASTGELKPLRVPGTAVAVDSAGIQPVGPPGEREEFEWYGVLLGSRFSVRDGRGVAADAARVNRGAGKGGDMSSIIGKSESSLPSDGCPRGIPLKERCMRGPKGLGGGTEFIEGGGCSLLG